MGVDPKNPSSFVSHTQPAAPSKDGNVESGEVAELVKRSLCEHEYSSSSPGSTIFKKLGMMM